MGEKGARQTNTGAAMAERICSGGAAFLRADDTTATEYEAEGSERHGRMPYWTIPNTVLDDDDKLLEWAGRALEVARSAKR